MQHGITERTANLTYSNESGALNESWSDVFGAMVERYAQGQTSNTWKIGEQCYTPGVAGDALRYMDNPHAASNSGYTADDDPDHYAERYTGTGDSGGVHINSGIANKAFYLLAVGGTHHRGGSMTGIGADAAAKIWYRALTSYMTSSTNFKGARTATLNAAAALYGSGSANYNAVAQAWNLCGVL
jgi:Zn-dependent metalloprotease